MTGVAGVVAQAKKEWRVHGLLGLKFIGLYRVFEAGVTASVTARLDLHMFL